MLPCWEYLVIYVFLPYTVWQFTPLVVSCGLYAVKFCHDSNHSCLIIYARDVTNPLFFFFLLVLQVLVFVSFLHHFRYVLCSICLNHSLVFLWLFFSEILCSYRNSDVSLWLPQHCIHIYSIFWSGISSFRKKWVNVICFQVQAALLLCLCAATPLASLHHTFFMPSFSVECPLAACELVAFKTVARIQCLCCNQCLYTVICDCSSRRARAANLDCYCLVYLFVFI